MFPGLLVNAIGVPVVHMKFKNKQTKKTRTQNPVADLLSTRNSTGNNQIQHLLPKLRES